MSYGRHRRPRWHDRPRAWLAATWNHLRGWDDEEEVLTDDHGNRIGDDLPPVDQEWDDMLGNPQVIRTAKVSGVHLPLSGDPNPWAPCAFRQDMPRPADKQHMSVETPRAAGPGQLTMWDIITCRDPWPPRPEPVTWAGARVPRYVLAGA